MDPELVAAHGRCMPHTQRIHLGVPPRGLETGPATRFHDASMVRDEVAAYAKRIEAEDLRAVASLWAKHYIGALLPGVAALMTLERVGLDADARNVVIETRDGAPHAAWLAAFAISASEAPELRAKVLPPLLDAHLAPLFDALERGCGLPRSVSWNSAGNTLAWYYDRFAERAPERAAEDRRALLEDATSPLRDPVRYDDLAPHGLPRRVQVRRVCCLRDRLPGKDPCYTCPRLSSRERVELITRLETAA